MKKMNITPSVTTVFPKRGAFCNNMKMYSLFFLVSLFTMSACKDEIGDDNTDPTPNCKATYRPVIMVHGFLGSGDTYALQFQRFESNDYCPNHLRVLNWNSLAFGGNDPTVELDALIDQVLQETGFSQVDLAGHSAGSSMAYEYLGSTERAAKVAHYAHIGGNPQAGPAGPNGEVPTLNIWSSADYIVEGDDIPGATNFMNAGKDHYEVATSVESFREMFRFFNDGEDPSLDITPQDEVEVKGTVLTFGENQAIEGAEVNVYELDANTGFRVGNVPAASATSTADGNYGPVSLRSDTHYEFEVIPNDGTRTVHYYREPFLRSHQLVLLRTLPSAGLGSILLGGLPQDDSQTVLAFYSGSQGIIHDRDVLTVNGHTLSTPEFTAAENATIAMFYYDGNGNQNTDLSPIGGTWDLMTSFLEAVDMHFPTQPTGSISLELNGRAIVVPNLQSATDGVIVAQFY
jgi:hypothetical protein